MYDDDKSMDVHSIFNQSVVNYNTLQFLKPMVLSFPWADYKNKKIHRYENVTNNLSMKHKKIKGLTQWKLVPLWMTI